MASELGAQQPTILTCGLEKAVLWSCQTEANVLLSEPVEGEVSRLILCFLLF